MNFTQAIQTCFRNYAKCSGEVARAARSEYWYWQLFCILMQMLANMLDYTIFPLDALHRPMASIVGLILLLPTINVAIRRLHDLNHRGLWLLLIFIPIIGPIILLIWFSRKGTVGPNNYGYDPLQ